MGKKKVLFVFLVVLLIIVCSEFAIFLTRAFSEVQIDDVTPGIQCDASLIEKSDVLFVIPLFENKSIADNKTWCEEMLLSGKKLEMHGVYHTYREFKTIRNESYLDEGIAAFEECFGFKPEGFKAPQMALSNENKKWIEKKMSLYFGLNQILHKVYHCNDTGVMPNRLSDIF